MTASLLPLPDDPRFQTLIDLWPAWEAMGVLRSKWLRQFEDYLSEFYPVANSRSLSLTARHYAPFPLAAGHDVP